ncbi:hypothetical protein [Halomarina oriensis]|uniref:DUF8160 domain-containing protein n=1 Tax=Halomarina oriensis TaxID=671145 RepID=A0A6B0GNL0_9EURY|nr:hypothetical protein [Halomarina oriensis]MWG36516.1 hypothetical protein [Halomarina oriensis]
MSDDERSRKVRDRFNASDDADGDDEEEHAGHEDPDEHEEHGEGADRESLDDEPTKRVPMHLPLSLRRRLERDFRITAIGFDDANPEERNLEKNRDFYPLVVELGLDAIADLDDPVEVLERRRGD